MISGANEKELEEANTRANILLEINDDRRHLLGLIEFWEKECFRYKKENERLNNVLNALEKEYDKLLDEEVRLEGTLNEFEIWIKNDRYYNTIQGCDVLYPEDVLNKLKELRYAGETIEAYENMRKEILKIIGGNDDSKRDV